jgi:hypothetical protein
MVSPTRAVVNAGTKHKLVISQPCCEEPRPFSIFTSSANAFSNPTEMNAKEKDKMNKLIPRLCITYVFILNIKLMLIYKTGAN